MHTNDFLEQKIDREYPTAKMTTDEKYMARCLYLARLGCKYVAPNPMVGAVLVYEDRIIGEGYHRQYGQAHAEPNAIRQVKNTEQLHRSTLYVNLEPCSHYGKTPPCVNLVIEKKIKRVVIGSLDPNPKVSGRGVAMLREAGVEVKIGVLEAESRELNKWFYCFQNNKRPYILLKWAQTEDGFIDSIRTENSIGALRISNPVTTQLTHKMRTENMAIMVGTNTVLLDNPSLTVRHWEGENPIRVIIDRKNSIPEHYMVKDGKVKTIIFSENAATLHPNLEYIAMQGDDTLSFILDELYKRNIHSVLVEGGAELLNSFIQADLWDECNVETSAQQVGEGVQAPFIPNTFIESEQQIEKHRWVHYRRRKF